MEKALVFRSYIVNPIASILISGYKHTFENEAEQAQFLAEEPAGLPDAGHELGDWPQRLLHAGIDGMRSYKWQPGNSYAGIKALKSNAILYT